MKKRIILSLIIILLLSLLTACGHEHTWQEATCTTPKTCSECGEIEGEALGHDWQTATCAAPETCTSCGITQGTALEHDWSIPNYETVSCSQCKETMSFLDFIPEFYSIGDTINVDPETYEISFTQRDYLSQLWLPDEYSIVTALESTGPVFFVINNPDHNVDNLSFNDVFNDSLLFFTLAKGKDDNYENIQQNDNTSKINMISLSYSTDCREDPSLISLIYEMVYVIDNSMSFDKFYKLFENMNDLEQIDSMEAMYGMRGATQMSSNLAFQYLERDNRFFITISSLYWYFNDLS